MKLMLAPNKMPDLANLVYPIYVQPKMDGFRCVFKNGQLLTRAGNPMGNSNLAGFLNTKNFPQHKIMDGELYKHGLSFPQLSSILRKDKAFIPQGLKFYVYDTMSLEEWEAEHCKWTYSDRLIWIRELINGEIADYKKVIDTPTDLCNTPGEVMDKYNYYLSQGYEGIMLKDPNGLYRWKKVTVNSGEMLKYKPFKSEDLKIEEVYTEKHPDRAAGVVVNYNNNAVRVSSGFDLALREKMAAEPSKFIGKTIEVRYLEVTEKGSLRHTSFTRFRPDKDEK